MKKFISIVFAIVLVLSLASCGKEKGPNPDNWHNNSGIHKWVSVDVGGEKINVGILFTNDGFELYYNDKIEKELFCKAEYGMKDTDPDNTATNFSLEDINKDGSTDVVTVITDENGEKKAIVMLWSDELSTFAPQK